MSFFDQILQLIRAQNDHASSTKDADDYLKDIEFLGRVYDYEIENEHLMTAFQQILDQTINDTKTYNFSSIISRVRWRDWFISALIYFARLANTKMWGNSCEMLLQGIIIAVHDGFWDDGNTKKLQRLLLLVQLLANGE